LFIELKDVSYTYLPGSQAAKEALGGVSLTLAPGEFIALIGPTGSGKSTLVQILAGLLRPSSGRVLFEGSDIWQDHRRLPERRRQVGLVFQEPERQLFEMTVADDVAFWPRNAGVAPDRIGGMVEAALTAVGLDHKVYAGRSPFTLSGGEMRRVAIAGVLVMKPGVLLFDEPTSGLDHRGRVEITKRIKALNEEGTAVVWVTHDMDEVAELAGRVILLDKGGIAADDTPRRLFQRRPLLADIGLQSPQVTEMATMLARRGLPVDSLPMTLAEIEATVLAALGKASA